MFVSEFKKKILNFALFFKKKWLKNVLNQLNLVRCKNIYEKDKKKY